MTELLQRRIEFAKQIDVKKCDIDKVQNIIMFLLSFENIPELTKFTETGENNDFSSDLEK